MSEVLDRIVNTREAAHAASLDAYRMAQQIIANGQRARIVASEHDDDRSLQQNRFYWGACLRDISEQAMVGGQRYTVDAWHELFRRQFLGYEIEKVRVAGRTRPVINRRLKSTRGLKVKPFSLYLEQLQAFAATDLGVRFRVSHWQEYRE
jgi:hypothetical protein